MSSLLGAALALLAALAVASATLAIRIGTHDGKTSEALIVVLAVNSLCLVPSAAILEYPTYGVTVASGVSFVLAGVVGTLFGRGLHYLSIRRVGANLAEPIKASQPLHASLLALVFLGEVLTVRHLAGILLVTVGVGLVVLAASDRSTPGYGDVSISALSLPFVAAFLFGVEPIFAKFGFKAGTPVLVGLSIKTVAAGVGFASYLFWRDALDVKSIREGRFTWYVAAGIANTAFLVSYYAALNVSSVTIVVPILQTSPVFVVAISAVFLRDLEQVTWRLVGGMVIVIAGSILVTLVR